MANQSLRNRSGKISLSLNIGLPQDYIELTKFLFLALLVLDCFLFWMENANAASGGDDGISIILEAGQYINFPEGTYQIESLENQDAKIAFVWNIENYASRFLQITWVIF